MEKGAQVVSKVTPTYGTGVVLKVDGDFRVVAFIDRQTGKSIQVKCHHSVLTSPKNKGKKEGQ